jgi:hypothetical protein
LCCLPQPGSLVGSLGLMCWSFFVICDAGWYVVAMVLEHGGEGSC